MVPTVTESSDAIVRRGETLPADDTDFGSMRWLLNGDAVPETAMTVGEVVINRGAKNALHVHGNAEEVLYLMAGALEHRVGDDTYHLEPGDCIRVPAGVPHDARSVGAEPARMVVCYNHPHRDFEALE
jgi:mannose-6-phosphate isomerase-like protein (cupin superfamily)